MMVFAGSLLSYVFTLYQRPGMSDQAFRHDEELVALDLQRLKALMEK
jgi:hypothetical protein